MKPNILYLIFFIKYVSWCPPLPLPPKKKKRKSLFKDGDQTGFNSFCFTTAPEKHKHSSITKA